MKCYYVQHGETVYPRRFDSFREAEESLVALMETLRDMGLPTEGAWSVRVVMDEVTI